MDYGTRRVKTLTRLLSMVIGRNNDEGWHFKFDCLTSSRVMLALFPSALMWKSSNHDDT